LRIGKTLFPEYSPDKTNLFTIIGLAENKGIITLRPGFGPLQATVLHQLEGERHIMNLQIKKKQPYFNTLKKY